MAFNCFTCTCWIPRSIFTRLSLVIGTPWRSSRRTSSVCPIPIANRASLIFLPRFPFSSCLIFCSNFHPSSNHSEFIYHFINKIKKYGTISGPFYKFLQNVTINLDFRAYIITFERRKYFKKEEKSWKNTLMMPKKDSLYRYY